MLNHGQILGELTLLFVLHHEILTVSLQLHDQLHGKLLNVYFYYLKEVHLLDRQLLYQQLN